MSINGIPSPYAAAGIVPGLGRGRAQDETARAEVATRTPATQPQALAPQGEALPVEAPPGTDPALWSVLNAEERSFFARIRTMGPLTYGPGTSPASDATGALQGGRLDVRV